MEFCRDHDEMVEIDAEGRIAEMMDFVTLRNWSVCPFIENGVRQSLFQSAVAIITNPTIPKDTGLH